MVGQSSEDTKVGLKSSLQTTDIPLWRRRWTMRFQILTAKILFDFLCLWFYNGTFVVCRPTGKNLICFPLIYIPPLFASKKLFWRKIKTPISNTTLPIIGMLLKQTVLSMGDLVFLLNQQHHTDKLNFRLACRPLLFVLLLVKPSPYVPFTFPLQWFLILQILRISLLNSLPHPTVWGLPHPSVWGL